MMTREEAFAELKKRWGKRGAYYVGKRLSSQERRDAAKAALQPLYEEQRALNRRISALEEEARYYKFKVVETNWRGMTDMEMVHGRGDTWEEAFADADTKKASQAS